MALAKSEVVIYHNPACTTSRKVLGMIRDAGRATARGGIPEDAAEPERSCWICCAAWDMKPR